MSFEDSTSLVSLADYENLELTVKDYQTLLKKHNANYKLAGYYYQIGEHNCVQGWLLHLSVIIPQLEDLLKVLLPILISENVTFKIPINREMAKCILNGQLGYTQLGKILTIYPENEKKALGLAQRLLELTKEFKGPQILTDRYLGGVVYTRYGAHKAISVTGEGGNQENMIHDCSGNLVKDHYTIPFKLSNGISWPFSTIAPPEAPKEETILQDRYKPISILKEDARGNVRKCLWLEKFWLVKWCIVKEGKRYMFTDDSERDIRHRLQWQYELHLALYNSVPIPKVFDFFEENGNSYLAMEYVKGETLDVTIINIFQDQSWSSLPLNSQLRLLDFSIQMFDIIEKLHKINYIHRDITPVNFLVTKTQKLVMIDLELAYSIELNKPSPPFRYGTTWFMSPQQQLTEIPSFKDDIYSIGATLIVLLTGMLPSRFTIINQDLLVNELNFFIEDKVFVQWLSKCFCQDPNSRPDLTSLKKEILRLKVKLLNRRRSNQIASVPKMPEIKDVENIITFSIKALATSKFVNDEKLWWSKTIQDNTLNYYQAEDSSIYGSFYIGLSGIMFLLARAQKLGFSVNCCADSYARSLQFINTHYITRLSQLPAGLFAGTAGIAMTLVEGIENRLIPEKEQAIKNIYSCFNSKRLDALGVVKGIAGQGIALLRASELLDNSIVKSYLEQYVDLLIKSQNKDGSWTIETDDKKEHVKITGFGHGIAGITSFLLSYWEKYKDVSVQKSTIKALHWLIQQAKKNRNGLYWNLDNTSKLTEPGLTSGWAGIILTFIKGYELFQEPVYRHTAESALNNYPLNIMSRDLTLNSGIAGLGEVYLEGCRVFNTGEWQSRADWIALSLMHQVQQQSDGSFYWLVDDTPFSTADFMTGNSGIIHFLLRYCRPGQLNHPLMPK